LRVCVRASRRGGGKLRRTRGGGAETMTNAPIRVVEEHVVHRWPFGRERPLEVERFRTRPEEQQSLPPNRLAPSDCKKM
jgi:hypothetical protein